MPLIYLLSPVIGFAFGYIVIGIAFIFAVLGMLNVAVGLPRAFHWPLMAAQASMQMGRSPLPFQLVALCWYIAVGAALIATIRSVT